MKIKQYKKEFGHSYAIGVYPTLELLRYRSRETMEVLIDQRGNDNSGVRKIKELAQKNHLPITNESGLVEKLSDSGNCYALGIFRKYSQTLENSKNHILLVNPSDMGNLGTIIRTMIGFDVCNLAIIKPAADIFHPKVIRASMGEIFQTKFQYFGSLTEYKKLYTNNLYIISGNGKETIDQIKFTKPYTLVFGNEGLGLTGEYIKAGPTISIPQSSNIDSLNLSVAVGIALYASYNNRTIEQ
jgi:RNA methyltransferase, TrmH family